MNENGKWVIDKRNYLDVKNILNSSELESNLSENLKDYFRLYKQVALFLTSDYSLYNVSLPEQVMEGSIFTVKNDSTLETVIERGENIYLLDKGRKYDFIYNQGKWEIQRVAQVNVNRLLYNSSQLSMLSENLPNYYDFYKEITLLTTDTYKTDRVILPTGVEENSVFTVKRNSITDLVIEREGVDFNLDRNINYTFKYNGNYWEWIRKPSVDLSDLIPPEEMDKLANISEDYYKEYKQLNLELTNNYRVAEITLPSSVEIGSVFYAKNSSKWVTRVNGIDLKSAQTVKMVYNGSIWTVEIN